VLDREGGKMRIGHELSPNPGQRKELAEYVGMAFGRLWNPNNVASKPAHDLAPRVFRGEWADENASIGYDTQKTQEGWPG